VKQIVDKMSEEYFSQQQAQKLEISKLGETNFTLATEYRDL